MYANRLVYEFENGFLTDCENGCTLRSYLARKLNCAPMRISKKFSGRCIGKLAYVNSSIHNETRTVLRDLEDIYVRSLKSGSDDSAYSGTEVSSSDDSYQTTNASSDYIETLDSTVSDLDFISLPVFEHDKFGLFRTDNDYISDNLYSSIPPVLAIQLLEQQEWQDVLSSFCEDEFTIDYSSGIESISETGTFGPTLPMPESPLRSSESLLEYYNC